MQAFVAAALSPRPRVYFRKRIYHGSAEGTAKKMRGGRNAGAGLQNEKCGMQVSPAFSFMADATKHATEKAVLHGSAGEGNS
jgi:hypothetical protein